mmetsp:Transcript_14115/g.29489  ORF Transcript_14115/g.29489 Transcript_14115/m.29489 type:complete len:108 (-) Transcript_14115:99-422(-)
MLSREGPIYKPKKRRILLFLLPALDVVELCGRGSSTSNKANTDSGRRMRLRLRWILSGRVRFGRQRRRVEKLHQHFLDGHRNIGSIPSLEAILSNSEYRTARYSAVT